MEQNSKDKAVAEILTGLKSRRPADQPAGDVPIEQKLDSTTGVEFEAEQTEKAEISEKEETEKRERTIAQVLEALRKRHEAVLKEIEEKNLGEKTVQEMNLRFEIIEQSGARIIAEYLSEKNVAEAEMPQEIEGCFDKLYSFGPNTRENLYTLVRGSFSPDSEAGQSSLESFGVQKNKFGNLIINGRDLWFIKKDMAEYEAKEYPNICRQIFSEQPDKIKQFLKTDDGGIIIQTAKEQISPYFKQSFEKWTADTPERVKDRIRQAIWTNIRERFLGIRDSVQDKKRLVGIILDEFQKRQLRPTENDVQIIHDKLYQQIPNVVWGSLINKTYKEQKVSFQLSGEKEYVLENPEKMDEIIWDFIRERVDEFTEELTVGRTPEEAEREKKQNIRKMIESVFGKGVVSQDEYLLPLIERARLSKEFTSDEVNAVASLIRERHKELEQSVIDKIYLYNNGSYTEDEGTGNRKYVLDDEEKVKDIALAMLENEIRDIIREVIAERKPESEGETIFSPEQQKELEIFCAAVKEEYGERFLSGNFRENTFLHEVRMAFKQLFQEDLVGEGIFVDTDEAAATKFVTERITEEIIKI